MKNLFSFIAYYLLYTVWYVFSLLPFRVLYVISDFLYLALFGRTSRALFLRSRILSFER